MLQEMSPGETLSGKIIPSPDELTIQERQLWLNEASREFLDGNISEDTLRKIEGKLEVDYAQAALDQASVRSEISSILKKMVANLVNAFRKK
jgi:hypothetical protein